MLGSTLFFAKLRNSKRQFEQLTYNFQVSQLAVSKQYKKVYIKGRPSWIRMQLNPFTSG